MAILFIESGADVTGQDDNKDTFLHIAVCKNNLKVIQAIVDKVLI